MQEGGLQKPTRYNIDWTDPDFINKDKLDEELRRVFDICHGCRRCFNLCDSFPRLFELVDEADTGELDSVSSSDFGEVIDACTLCDLCFMTKCPYVPPHEFNLDFPHLMLRYKTAEFNDGKVSKLRQQMANTDSNAKLATPLSGVVNWASNTENTVTRPVLEATCGIHKKAHIPKFANKPFMSDCDISEPNKDAPGFGNKVLLYTSCYGNYNNPQITIAAMKVLAHNGIEVLPSYIGCCGMPNLEQGNLELVAEQAKTIAAALRHNIEQGYTVVSTIPSCVLMMKSEWPLLLPDDDNVQVLSKSIQDISEYLVSLSKEKGLTDGLQSLGEDVTIHIACHARAQNIGQKGAELLKLLPETNVEIIERCSGHGGIWGMMKDNFDVAIKVGKPVARQAAKSNNKLILSECPLAGEHILQGITELENDTTNVVNVEKSTAHPIEILAKAYGL